MPRTVIIDEEAEAARDHAAIERDLRSLADWLPRVSKAANELGEAMRGVKQTMHTRPQSDPDTMCQP